MTKIDYGSNQGRAYDEYLPEDLNYVVRKYWLGEREEPLNLGLTPDEFHQQLPNPWTGLNIALALVCACLASALLLHAAARAGWL